MESCRASEQNLMQDFMTKLIEFISQTHSCSPLFAASSNSFTKSYSPKPSSIHDSIRVLWENQQTPHKEFEIDLLECIEGCHPLLLERWKFHIIPKRLAADFSKNLTETPKIAGIRALMAASLLLPASEIRNSSISLIIRTASQEGISWDPSILPRDIQYFPSIPFKFETAFNILSVRIEYTTKNIKPRIISQTLGIRPRLTSVDGGDFELKDVFKHQTKSQISLLSTDASPETPRLRSRSRMLSLIESESFYEESEVGFKLIYSDLCTDDYDPSSDEENDTFAEGFFENPFGSLESSNDTRISLYRKQCDKIREVNLFKGSSNSISQVREILTYWANRKTC
ncbi:unnamed protein product [Blepharisma stoltei]|uniref:Uncharacterized protein n=1 Tax=Blepharisma stoltei TaxID=1481888 RepID=A0AAU9IFD9_9CILI|nr:unnamed protein product [Blepharisma stoltei]